MKKIDLYNHFFPKPAFDKFVELSKDENLVKRLTDIPSVVDLDIRLEQIKSFGPDYCQVLSMPTPPIESFGEHAVEMAQLSNDGFAELVAKYPNQFPTFIASLPANNVEESVKEAKRAIEKLGARGIQLFTNVQGVPLDDPKFAPLFDLMAGYDLPIFIHPIRAASIPDYPKVEKKSRFEIWWGLGWPYETSAFMIRFVFNTKYFDKYPNLKVLAHHLGAMIPYLNGRIKYGFAQLGSRTLDEDYTDIIPSMKKPMIDYFKSFYADTALQGDECGATEMGLKFFGVDRTMFASDAPMDPEKGTLYVRLAIKAINELPISEEERAKIFEGNARKFLKL